MIKYNSNKYNFLQISQTDIELSMTYYYSSTCMPRKAFVGNSAHFISKTGGWFYKMHIANITAHLIQIKRKLKFYYNHWTEHQWFNSYGWCCSSFKIIKLMVQFLLSVNESLGLTEQLKCQLPVLFVHKKIDAFIQTAAK